MSSLNENTDSGYGIDISDFGQSTGPLSLFFVKEKKELLLDDTQTGDTSIDVTSTNQPYRKYDSQVIRKHGRILRTAEKTMPIQKWEGYVLSVDDDKQEFTAVIADKTNLDNPDEEITISQDELSISELAYLDLGAVFYWSIGYAYRGATKTKFSVIRFSRLKGYSSSAVSDARKEADELMELFNAN